MLASGMSAEQALGVFMAQSVTSDPRLGAILSGPQLGAIRPNPPGLQPTQMQLDDKTTYMGATQDTASGAASSTSSATPLRVRQSSKTAALSSPRGRNSIASPSQSWESSKPPPSPDLTEKLRAPEQAKDKAEQEKVRPEKRLKTVAVEAETNEKAREYSHAQKDHEVGRLQSLVTHASNQNQQLRRNEQTQTREVLKGAEPAVAFKSEAERLMELQTQSAK